MLPRPSVLDITLLGLRANVVVKHVSLSAVLHVAVALKRTRDDLQLGGSFKTCVIPSRLCVYPRSVNFARLSRTERLQRLRVQVRPSVSDRARPLA